MSKPKLAFALAAGLFTALLIVAFIIAPHACEWGLTVYFWSGLAVTIALAAIPACLLRELRPWKWILATLGLGVLGVATWIGGLFAADIQIICRLF